MRLLYDDDALYIGARLRAYGTPPRFVRRSRVAMRESDAEVFTVSLDTYLDRRTAYSFSISSGGVRGDFYHSQDSEDSGRESQFDPVWSARTRVDAEGWTAELRIPFSQLRFNAAGKACLGTRAHAQRCADKSERIQWVLIPSPRRVSRRTSGGWRVLRGIPPARRLEVMPYVATDLRIARTSTRPIRSTIKLRRSRWRWTSSTGLGRTSRSTPRSIPDFGQVELDPAVVEPHRVRDGVRRAPAILHRGQRVAHGPRPELHRTSELVLQPSHRRVAARLGDGRLRGCADRIRRSSRRRRSQAGWRPASRSARSAAVTPREYARTYNVASDAIGANRRRAAELVRRGARSAGIRHAAVQRGRVAHARASARSTSADSLNRILPRNAIAGGADWRLALQAGNVRAHWLGRRQSTWTATRRRSPRCSARARTTFSGPIRITSATTRRARR